MSLYTASNIFFFFQNTLHSWLWNFRYLSLIVGIIVYIWEWYSYRETELKNSRNIEKIQRQMKRLMQYYGLDTTEVPEGAFGTPPPPPPVAVPGHSPGRRASDGLIGPYVYQQSSPIQPTRPRHSMPASVGMAGIGAATRQTGFAAVLDAVRVLCRVCS